MRQVSSLTKALIPVFPSHRTYRRCIFIKQKLEVYKVLRLSSALKSKFTKNSNRYAIRSLESVILNDNYIINNEKLSVIIDLINAVFMTSLVSNDMLKQRDEKKDYRTILIFKLLDLFFYRVMIPIFIEAMIHFIFHHTDKAS